MGAEVFPLKSKKPRRIRRGQLPTENPQSVVFSIKGTLQQRQD